MFELLDNITKSKLLKEYMKLVQALITIITKTQWFKEADLHKQPTSDK